MNSKCSGIKCNSLKKKVKLKVSVKEFSRYVGIL